MAYQKNGSFGLAVMVLPRAILSEQDYFHGYHATTMKCPSRPVKYACVKSLDYNLYYSAFERAKKKGFHEALLINTKGFIFEGSRSNVFFLKKGVLCTPSLTLGCLNGITRQLVMECARDMKISIKNVKPKLQDFLTADEIFLTNALIGVMPVTQLEGKKIHSVRVGDKTYQIRKTYLKKFFTVKPSLNPLIANV
jgi:4-amino-4-deoxychorismate lyase